MGPLFPELSKVIPALESFLPYSICLESSSSRPSGSWLLLTIPKSLNLSLGSASILNEHLSYMGPAHQSEERLNSF